MAGETTNATPAAPTLPPTAQSQGQQPGAPQHHSARQPRDEGQRFAGPPAQTPPGEVPVPATLSKRRYVLGIEDGKEVSEELDDAEIAERLKAARARQYLEKQATQRFQRASELVKEAETAKQVAQALVQKNPAALRAYFEQNGQDPANALADVLEAILQEREMSPEQKELAKLRAQNAALEEQRRRTEEDGKARAFQETMDRIRPEVQRVWSHALEQESLPKTEAMLERAAEIFLTALDAGQHLSPEQVAELTRMEMVEAQRALVETMDPSHVFKHYPGMVQKLDEGLTPEQFEQKFPKLAKRYWAFLAAKVKGPARRGAAPAPGAPRPAAKPQEDGGGVMDPYLMGKVRSL